MELIDKRMIRISTDPTNLSTDCIGISSTPRVKKIRGRGRPKGSKSKHKKRSIIESETEYEQYYLNNNASSHNEPRRKKRKPNRAHREAFPDATDEDIRKQLALERKAKNRKSAQESRERRKKQEAYLNDRLPKGLALKELLKSNKLIKNGSSDLDIDYTNCSLEECLSRDAELREMKMILDEMCDNYASEYDQYAQVQRDKKQISDELIIDILKEYISNGLNNNNNNNDNDIEEAIHLETDIDTIHLQVIGEIQNGVPMQIDSIPESATPNSFKATRGRKSKHNHKKHHVLKTPPTIPFISNHNDTELPPPVFGMDSHIDFSIAPESASGFSVKSICNPIPLQSEQSSMYHQTRTTTTDTINNINEFNYINKTRRHNNRTNKTTNINDISTNNNTNTTITLSNPNTDNDSTTNSTINIESSNETESSESSASSSSSSSSQPAIITNNSESFTNNVYNKSYCTMPTYTRTNAFYPSFTTESTTNTFTNNTSFNPTRYSGNETNAYYGTRYGGYHNGSYTYSSWQNQWKQWQEWQEFQEWKQFKQYKQWRDSTGREYSTGNENITSISTNSSNIYNNNMWNENDIMSTTTETTISNKNKQNNNRFKRVNNKLYEPIRESQEHNIESYTKQLYTTNNNTNKTTSIITNTINNGCKLTLPSLSTNCNGNITKYETTNNILSENDNQTGTSQNKERERFEYEIEDTTSEFGIDFIPTTMFRGISNESDGLFNTSFQIGPFDKI